MLNQISAKNLVTEKEIGKGGYGIVYLGKWHKTPVAIKKLLLTHPSKATLEEFKKEAEIMTNCQHPNIVRFYGACLEPEQYALVMDYVAKGSLYHVLQNPQEKLLWPQRLDIAEGIGLGLHYLHEKKIIHRDFKSLNILLDKDYQPKITDFGLSKVKLETSTSATQNKVSSIRWQAPELFQPDSSSTMASDIYSCGMVFWELASRKTPFEKAPSEMIAMSWILQGTKEKIPTDTPADYGKIIQQCWQSAEKRPSAHELTLLFEKNKLQTNNNSQSHSPKTHSTTCICSQCMSLENFVLYRNSIVSSTTKFSPKTFLEFIQNEEVNFLPFDLCQYVINSEFNFDSGIRGYVGHFLPFCSVNFKINEKTPYAKHSTDVREFFRSILVLSRRKEIEKLIKLLESNFEYACNPELLMQEMNVNLSYWKLYDFKNKTKLAIFFSVTLPKFIMLLENYASYMINNENLLVHITQSNHVPLFYYLSIFMFGGGHLIKKNNPFSVGGICLGTLQSFFQMKQIDSNVTDEIYNPIPGQISSGMSHSLYVALEKLANAKIDKREKQSLHTIAHLAVFFYASPFYTVKIGYTQTQNAITFAEKNGLLGELIEITRINPELYTKVCNTSSFLTRNLGLFQAFSKGELHQLHECDKSIFFYFLDNFSHVFYDALRNKKEEVVVNILKKMHSILVSDAHCSITTIQIYTRILNSKIPEKSGITILHYLAEFKSVESFTYLFLIAEYGVDIPSVNEVDAQKNTPLFVAIATQSLQCAKFLAEKEANLNNLNEKEWDVIQVLAIHFSPRNKEDWEIATSLIQKSISPPNFPKKYQTKEHPMAIALCYDNEESFDLLKLFQFDISLEKTLSSLSTASIKSSSLKKTLSISNFEKSRFLWWYQNALNYDLMEKEGKLAIDSIAQYFPHSITINLSIWTLGPITRKALTQMVRFYSYQTNRSLPNSESDDVTKLFPLHYREAFLETCKQAILNDDIATLHFFDCLGFPLNTSDTQQNGVSTAANYLKNIELKETSKKFIINDQEGILDILSSDFFTDTYFETKLFHTVRAQNLAATKFLLNYYNVNFKNHASITPVMVAALLPSLPILKLIVENGGNINAKSLLGWTAIFFAVVSRRDANFSYLITRKNIDLTIKTIQGESIIDFLLAFGRFDLLEVYADIFDKNLSKEKDYQLFLNITNQYQLSAKNMLRVFPALKDQQLTYNSILEKIINFARNHMHLATILLFRGKETHKKQLYIDAPLPKNSVIDSNILKAAQQGKLFINLPKHSNVSLSDIQQIISEITTAALLGDIGGISLERCSRISGTPIRVALNPAYVNTFVGKIWMYTDYFYKVVYSQVAFVPEHQLQVLANWHEQIEFSLDSFTVNSLKKEELLKLGIEDPKDDQSLKLILSQYVDEEAPKKKFCPHCLGLKEESSNKDYHSWYISMEPQPYKITSANGYTVITPNNKMQFIMRKKLSNGKLEERIHENFAALLENNMEAVLSSSFYGRYFQLLDIVNQLKPLIEQLVISGVVLTSQVTEVTEHNTPEYMPYALYTHPSDYSLALTGGVAYSFSPIETIQTSYLPSHSFQQVTLQSVKVNSVTFPVIPSSSSSFESKTGVTVWVNDTVTFTGMSSNQKGQIAEDMVEKHYTQRGYTKLASKMNSNQGIDGIYVKQNRNGTTEIEINETKYNPYGKFKGGTTKTKGPQMSQFWIRETVSQMTTYDKDPDVKNVGWQLTEMINQEGIGFFARRKISVVDKHSNIHWYNEKKIKELNN